MKHQNQNRKTKSTTIVRKIVSAGASSHAPLKLVSKTKTSANAALVVYLDSLAASGKRSMRSLLGSVEKIIKSEYSVSTLVWHQLDYQQIQRVRVVMIERGLSANTINLSLAGVRGVAKAAFNLGLMDSTSWMRIQAVKRANGVALSKGRSLSSSEISSMIHVCSKRNSGVRGLRDQAILLVGCCAGLRCSEITGLSIDDVDVNVGLLRVLKAKANKQRSIYLSTVVVDALREWIKCIPDGGSRLLFRQIYKGGGIGARGLSAWGVAVLLREIQASSGVDRFSPHDMRRTFITTLLEKNVDINSVRKLVGHADITTTARYDKRGDRMLKKASRSMKI